MEKDAEILAPDILDGKVINGLEESNSWITAIQSVLIQDEEEMCALSQECRLESVHFLGEKDPGIFYNMVKNRLISRHNSSSSPRKSKTGTFILLKSSLKSKRDGRKA